MNTLPDPIVTLTSHDQTLTVHEFTFGGEAHWIVRAADGDGDAGIVLTDTQALALAAALKVSVLGPEI